MTLASLRVPERSILVPHITVFGVGGAGCNAVNNLLARGLDGAEFVAANTDSQSLGASMAENRIQLGLQTTGGLGAGTDPEMGRKAAQESTDEIKESLDGCHLCFITAGMGGGTGTGAAPEIARTARECGVLTVGVVTKPFFFEGSKRMTVAEAGIEELQQEVNTLIVIPNQNLFQISTEATTITEALSRADDVLYQGVKSVMDLMLKPGLLNRDFADVRSVFGAFGRAMLGVGEAEGDERGRKAAEIAMSNKLLEETRLSEAKSVLINIIGGSDKKLWDVNDASEAVQAKVGSHTNVIVGSTLDPEFDGRVKVAVIATGLKPVEFSAYAQESTVADELEENAPEVHNYANEEPEFESTVQINDVPQVEENWLDREEPIHEVAQDQEAYVEEPRRANGSGLKSIFVAPKRRSEEVDSAPEGEAITDLQKAQETRRRSGYVGQHVWPRLGIRRNDAEQRRSQEAAAEAIPREPGSAPREEAEEVPAILRRLAS